jgi:hypothetical protein
MKDEKKTKKQFINELREPQQGITEVKGSESVHNRVEYELLKVNRALEVIGKCKALSHLKWVILFC